MELWALPNLSVEHLFLFVFRGWIKDRGHIQFQPPWVRAVWQQHKVDLSEAEVVCRPSPPCKSRLRRRNLHPGVAGFVLRCRSQLILEHYYWDPFTFFLSRLHPTIHTTFLLSCYRFRFPPSCSFPKWLLPFKMPPGMIFLSLCVFLQ